MREGRAKFAFAAILAAMLQVASLSAAESEETQVYEFDIPVKNAAAALKDVARVTRRSLLFQTGAVEHTETNPLSGRYSLDDAISLLFAGTNLSGGLTENGVITVALASDNGTQTREEKEMSQKKGIDRLLTSVSSAVLAGVGALGGSALWGSAAFAQDSASEDVIVVTGSRIARSGTTTPTPTVILGAEEITQAGSIDVGELLRELPAIGPGLNSDSTAPTFSSAGLNLIDLRRLGTDRTLVLVDGRRHVGSNPGDTAVDLSTIPTQLIERVDVITGGASAVYGADAVAGVVNIIMKKDFEGLELDIQGGISDEGDAEQFRVSATGGVVSGDGRMRATFHAAYSREDEIAWDARDSANSGRLWIPNPANTGPSDGIDDFVILEEGRQLGGQQDSIFILDFPDDMDGPQAFAFNPDGSVRDFAVGPIGILPGDITNGGEAAKGFDSECPQNECQLKVPLQRFLIQGGFQYDFSDSLQTFVEGKFASTQAESRIGSVFEFLPFTNRFPLDHPFVTDEMRDLHIRAGADQVEILRSNMELGPRGTDQDRRTFQMTVGARGDLNDSGFAQNLKYETYFQYGSTLVTVIRLNDLFQNRFEKALDAVVDPDDGIVKCRSVVEGTQQDPGCTPVNLFRPGAALTPENLAFIKIPNPTETAELEQFVASGVLAGTLGFDPFRAGPIGFAIGGEWRQESSVFTPAATQAGTPAGLSGNIPVFGPDDLRGIAPSSSPGSGLGFFNSTRRPTAGQFEVYEFFGEVLVPVFDEGSALGSLNVESAVRWADYSTSGSATSWKFGGDWSPVSDIRFRGVRSRAVRAPNVGELFSPGTQGFVTVDDPCDENFINAGSPTRAANCAALGITQPFQSNARLINIRTDFGGNPELDVESADTWTVGAVLQPSAIPGFSITADYFSINIKNAINNVGTQDTLNACVDLDSIDNQFCANITRDSEGRLILVQTRQVNVSNFKREGIDVEARYSFDTDFGQIGVSAVATRMLTNESILAPGTLFGSNVLDELGEIGDPKWRMRGSTLWRNGPASAIATVNFMSNQVPDVQTPEGSEDNRLTTGTGGHVIVDLQGQYDLTDNTTVRFGINNVLDNLPPNLPDTRRGGAGSFAGAEIFPVTGRFFYVGARVRF